jgi:DNA-binding NarL/FixJ family response regulator
MVALNEHHALSPRQREILALLCEGLSARPISVELGLSEATVRNHIHGILHRLGCHSQIEAVAKARREHLVEITPA